MGNFINRLSEMVMDVDKENIEQKYVLPEDFSEKTGIHHKRFWALFKNPTQQMTLEEAKKISDYYTQKTGQEIKTDDLLKEE